VTAFYGKPRWQTMYLTANTGYGVGPALGVTYDMLNVSVTKNGGDFEEKVVAEDGWRDLGGGYYSLLLTETDLNTIGELYAVIEIYAIGAAVNMTVDVDPAPFYIEANAPTCTITGSIVDIGGSALPASITFRPRNVPSAAGQSLVASGSIQTMTDAYGNFSVKLLRGAKVLVEIEYAGIRHLITVPELPNASIIDLLPPIPLQVP